MFSARGTSGRLFSVAVGLDELVPVHLASDQPGAVGQAFGNRGFARQAPALRVQHYPDADDERFAL